jgi:hypothetical protein
MIAATIVTGFVGVGQQRKEKHDCEEQRPERPLGKRIDKKKKCREQNHRQNQHCADDVQENRHKSNREASSRTTILPSVRATAPFAIAPTMVSGFTDGGARLDIRDGPVSQALLRITWRQ